MEYFVNHFQTFLLIWVRIAAAIQVAPVFSSRHVPIRIKLILAFLIAMMVYPWVSELIAEPPGNALMYGIIILKELLVGIVIGFILAMIFASFQLGAQFFAVQIGLGMSQVMDPFTQEQTPLLGYLFYSIAVLIFLSLGGMHMMVRAWVDSYEMLPAITWIGNEQNFLELGIRYFTLMFIIGLKISFPVISASLIVILALGLLGKAAPQANILILGLPMQYGVGMIMVLLLLPVVVQLFGSLVDNGIRDAMQYLKNFRMVALP